MTLRSQPFIDPRRSCANNAIAKTTTLTILIVALALSAVHADTITQPLKQFGFPSPGNTVQFHPTDDKILLTSGFDAVIFDISDGSVVISTRSALEARTATFSPDASQVLTTWRHTGGSLDSTATLWDSDTGEEIRTFGGSVRSAAFSPDGTQVLTGGGVIEDHYNGHATDAAARLWDIATGTEIHTFMFPKYSIVKHVAFSSDGKLILGASSGTVVVWDANSFFITSTFTDVSTVSVAFSPDGTHLLTGGPINTAILWEVETGTPVRTFTGHTGRVQSVAFSSNGDQVLTASNDFTIKLWDTETATEIRTFSEHTDNVSSAAFSPDNSQILSGARDGTVRLRNTTTAVESLVLSGHSNFRSGDGTFRPLTDAKFSPDETQVLTSADGGSIAKLWDVDSTLELQAFSGHTSDVTSVAFSPDGSQVLTGSLDRTADYGTPPPAFTPLNS